MKWLAMLLHLLAASPVLAQTVASSSAVLEGSSDSLALKLTTWEMQTRNHVDAVISAIPRIPAELRNIAERLHDDASANGSAPLSIILAAFGLAGMLAERMFRKRWGSYGGGIEEFVPTALFAAVMAVSFFAIEWPRLVRVVIARYLSAFVLYRLFSAAIRLAARTRKCISD